MDKNAVRQFAIYLGTKVESVSSQGWALVRCPLAPWLHESGKDSSPSAAISVVKGGESRFHCFACENHDLLGLLQRLRGLGAARPKYRIKEALELVNAQDEEGLVIAVKDYDAPADPYDDGNNDATFSEAWLNTFKPAVNVPLARDYLQGRGVSLHTADEMDLRFDTGLQTVCFPIRDFEGVLCGLRGRRIKPTGDQPPYHIYKNEEKRYNRRVWLGEHHLDWSLPVLMVESVFDYAACLPVYGNVVAPLTVGMSGAKVRRMASAVDIVTLFDKGKGGQKARELVDKHLPSNHRVHLIPCGPHRTDPSEVATDPGEMQFTALVDLLKEHLPLD